MFFGDALYHVCARVCSLALYSRPSKCQIQVPTSSLECSHPCDMMHWCLSGAMGLAVFMQDSNVTHYEFVSGAGRLQGQCACHILLVAVRIWRTLMFYQVLPSAVCRRQKGPTAHRSTFSINDWLLYIYIRFILHLCSYRVASSGD